MDSRKIKRIVNANSDIIKVVSGTKEISEGNVIWSPSINALNLFNDASIIIGMNLLTGRIRLANENIRKIRIKFDIDKLISIKNDSTASTFNINISDLYNSRGFSMFTTSTSGNSAVVSRPVGKSQKTHSLSAESMFVDEFAEYIKISENEYLIYVKKQKDQLIDMEINFAVFTGYDLQNFIRLYNQCDFDIKLYK